MGNPLKMVPTADFQSLDLDLDLDLEFSKNTKKVNISRTEQAFDVRFSSSDQYCFPLHSD